MHKKIKPLRQTENSQNTNSQQQQMFSQASNCSQSQTNGNINLYNCVIGYRQYTKTSNLSNLQLQLATFIQRIQQRILFIFGPSGSGKHMLVNSLLDKHKIPYQYRAQLQLFNYKDSSQQQDYQYYYEHNKKYKKVRQLILQSIQQQRTQLIHIYQEFPYENSQIFGEQLQKIRKFKQQFFERISNKNNRQYQYKVIFILNSQIYNKYYIIPKDKNSFVQQMVLQPYKIKQINSILAHFNQFTKLKFNQVISNKNIMEQIVEVSNGDMRKILLLVFQKKIEKTPSKMQYMDKMQKKQYKFQLQNQQKFQLFHLLGKFLYAKRYDVHLKQHRYFNREQLLKSDPPFYFNPVQIFLKSSAPLPIFHDLLFENYLDRTFNISDVAKISQMFAHLDSQFPIYISSKKMQGNQLQFQNIYLFLLTWGIILKNKSSQNTKNESNHKYFKSGLNSFRKSEMKYINMQKNTKIALIRRYFPFHKVQQCVLWGIMLKNNLKPIDNTKKYLIQSIIKKRMRMQNRYKQQQNIYKKQQQQQELIKPDSNFENDFLQTYKKKKNDFQTRQNDMKSLLMQQDDESDIDQDTQMKNQLQQ